MKEYSVKKMSLEKKKRIRRLEKLKEEEERQPTMKKLKKICIEITNENVVKWKERRNVKEKEKKERDKKKQNI